MILIKQAYNTNIHDTKFQYLQIISGCLCECLFQLLWRWQTLTVSEVGWDEKVFTASAGFTFWVWRGPPQQQSKPGQRRQREPVARWLQCDSSRTLREWQWKVWRCSLWLWSSAKTSIFSRFHFEDISQKLGTTFVLFPQTNSYMICRLYGTIANSLQHWFGIIVPSTFTHVSSGGSFATFLSTGFSATQL